MTKSTGLNLFNHCKQKNKPSNIKLNYNLIKYSQKVDEYSGDSKTLIKLKDKLKSYKDFEPIWECELSFILENKSYKLKNRSYRKKDALSNLVNEHDAFLRECLKK